MKEILYNKDNLTKEVITETVTRVKMLMLNSNNEILLGYCNKTYQFPGGHLEENESLFDCVKREVLEETGIEIDSEEKQPFFCIKHYGKNYRGTNENRCSDLYYFEIKIDEKYDLSKVTYTDWEKEGNFELRYINLNDVEQILIDSIPDNEQNQVIVREMLEVIKEYKTNRKGN